MSEILSRRSFLGVASACAAVGAMGLASCASESSSTVEEEGSESTGSVAADETIETEVLVAGLGASGVMAATAAAKSGAQVLAIDMAQSMAGTGNVNTTAPSVYASKAQEAANPECVTSVKEAYSYLLTETHYQENGKLLRNMLERSGICIDTAVEAGGQFMFTNTMFDASASVNDKTGAIYLQAGEDRAAVWEKMLADAGAQTRFGLSASELLFDGSGAIAGVRCLEGERVVDIFAKKVVLCLGGFLANAEMTAKYYAGAKMLSCGDQNATGAGVTMALSAGAQMGKNFSVSMNEFGGANFKATPMRYTFGDMPCNGALRLAIMGLLMVDTNGSRFFDEGIVRDEGMFAGEPLIRNSTYYAICDQAFIDRVKVESLSNLLAIAGKAAKEWKAISSMVLSNIEEDIDAAIAEEWAAKGDSIAELAEAFNLTNLEETVERYNAFYDAGEDDQFFVDPSVLVPVKTGPFYAIEYNPSAWLSLGGIKTDEECRAVDVDGRPIANLFVAGADADLWAVPYVSKGTANGFCLASGWLAGESAAAEL